MENGKINNGKPSGRSEMQRISHDPDEVRKLVREMKDHGKKDKEVFRQVKETFPEFVERHNITLKDIKECYEGIGQWSEGYNP